LSSNVYIPYIQSLVPPGALVGLGYRCREGSESYPPNAGPDPSSSSNRHHHQSGGNNNNNNSTYLDSYFPFDPYILRRSSKFVANPEVYRYWQAVAEVEGAAGVGKEGEEKEEDDDWSARSVTSGDPGVLSGEEEDNDDDDEEEEEDVEMEGEDSVVAMSIGSGVGSMYMRQAMGERTDEGQGGSSLLKQAAKKKKKKALNQNRPRIASMDFADDDEYIDGFGGEVPVGDTSVDDYDEEDDDDDHGGYDDDDGRYEEEEGGVDMHGVVGGDIGRVLAMDRIRKESIGSVGSW
jgi:hypothetical protein